MCLFVYAMINFPQQSSIVFVCFYVNCKPVHVQDEKKWTDDGLILVCFHFVDVRTRVTQATNVHDVMRLFTQLVLLQIHRCASMFV